MMILRGPSRAAAGAAVPNAALGLELTVVTAIVLGAGR